MMIHSRLRMMAAAPLLAAILMLAGSLSAASKHFTLGDLCETAHAVLHAKVLSSKAELTQDGAQIWTTWTLEVHERFKSPVVKPGEAQVSVAHTRGGVVGNRGVKASGEPSLSAGGEYLLFLWKNEDDRWCILGQRQGVFMVIRHEDGRVEARNSYRGVKVIEVDGQQVVEKVGPIVDTLESLSQRIRDIITPPPTGEPVRGGDGGEAPAQPVVPAPAPSPEPAPETVPEPLDTDAADQANGRFTSLSEEAFLAGSRPFGTTSPRLTSGQLEDSQPNGQAASVTRPGASRNPLPSSLSSFNSILFHSTPLTKNSHPSVLHNLASSFTLSVDPTAQQTLRRAA